MPRYMRRAICPEHCGGTLTTPTMPAAFEPLECRRLFAAAITYTLIELPFEPMDLNR